MRKAVLLLCLAGCSPASPPAAPAPRAKAERRTFASAVAAIGAVRPQVGAEVRVGSRISGRVERLHANLRDSVRKGQVIAELEKAELEAAAAERRAEALRAEARLASVERVSPREIEKAEAELAQRAATEVLARKDLERQDELLRQEFTTAQARDQAQERLLVAQAQVQVARKALDLARAQYEEAAREARAEVERARAALQGAEVQLSHAVIRAPIPGVVASVSTQEGETVAAGLSAPTFVTIVDLSRLQVEAFVDETDIGKVQVGQRASFTVDAFPATEFEARVVALYPKAVIQDNVVKYVVALEIAGEYAGRLRPEMTAAVTIRLESRTALAVPTKAVKREQGRNVVYVAGQARPVRLGWKDGPWVEVASGLAEGEEVLLEAPEGTK
jgi:macrolide-specific efflux system membrane fusion protein